MSPTMGIPASCNTNLLNGHIAALRVDYSDDNSPKCSTVGNYDNDDTEIKLIDDSDPAKGIKLTYYGDYNSKSKQSEFIIELLCGNQLTPVPTYAYEIDTSVYQIKMSSVFGCPLECPVANRELCGGNGLCYYDSDAGASRCYCNHGK